MSSTPGSSDLKRIGRDFAAAFLAVTMMVLIVNYGVDRPFPLPVLGIFVSAETTANLMALLHLKSPLAAPSLSAVMASTAAFQPPSGLTMTLIATLFSGLVATNLWFVRRLRYAYPFRRPRHYH